MSLLKKETDSFKYALFGIRSFLIKEDHGKVHLLATVLVVPAAFVLQTTATEKLLLLLTITLVWGMEMLNSAMEKTLDFMTSRQHPEIKYIKDVMAGAVLLAAGCSILTGIFILLPKLIQYVF
jgi:diacylglycerol kinase